MNEPVPPEDAPEHVVQLVLGSLQFSPRLPARVRPSAAARGGRGDQRRRLRAVQRGRVDQAPGPRRFGRLAPGRLDALGQPRPRLGQPRLQLHGPALRLHGGQRAVGRARLAPRRQGRHQGHGRRRRLRAPARRRPARSAARATWPSPTARRSTARSPTPAPTRASRSTSGFHRRRVGARRDRAAASTTRSPSTTRTASTSARRRSSTASTPAPSASPTSPGYAYQPFAGQEDEYRWTPEAPRPPSRTTTCSTSASERPDRLRSGRPGVSRQRDQAVARPSAPASVRVSGRSVQICVDAVAVVVTPSTLAADTAPTSRWDTDASSGPARPAHSTRN